MGNYLSNTPMKSDLSVVDNVDLTRYIGKWYEIARVPIPFAEPEKSKNVIETYSWNKSDPSVIDVRTDMDVDGKHKVITQKLWSVSSTNSKLKVSSNVKIRSILFALRTCYDSSLTMSRTIYNNILNYRCNFSGPRSLIIGF
jgi:lipocalin